MHEAELKEHDLGPHMEQIQAASKRCLVGEPVNEPTGSYFGGMPTVDRPFVWPEKDGYPLHFVGQLKCSEFDVLPLNTGVLLFFYDNRHWGYSPKDRGYAIVMHQRGEDATSATDLPESEVRTFFGLLKRRVKPTVYQRVDVAIHEGCSYPSLERNVLRLDGDVAEECYMEFCSSVQPLIQIGGCPSPIQSDAMETDCVKAFNHGKPEDWLLLLQLFEVGDMMWGDAGALYWFIHKDDLQADRFDRVWMVTQCH